jgi:hypothetical protein
LIALFEIKRLALDERTVTPMSPCRNPSHIVPVHVTQSQRLVYSIPTASTKVDKLCLERTEQPYNQIISTTTQSWCHAASRVLPCASEAPATDLLGCDPVDDIETINRQRTLAVELSASDQSQTFLIHFVASRSAYDKSYYRSDAFSMRNNRIVYHIRC